MQITTSPDIYNLQVQVRFDLSGTNPSVYLTNLSTGANLANMVWAFVVKSPTGTYIHHGDISNPDIVGSWTNYSLSDAWPRPFQSIEWSGANYVFYVIAKDSDGNVFTGSLQPAYICRPYGNTPTSKNYFGLASSNVAVKCQQARVFFEDTTYHSYKGNDGTRVGATLRVIYPIDETENIPTPFATADYVTALVPISYSSNNYQFLQNVIYDYDLGNDVTVRIKYQVLQTFAVWCNIDLEPLVCEFNKLMDDVKNGNCSDVVSAQSKLNLIGGKMCLVFIGIMQPLTGVDVPTVIEEIKSIGGFDCNCCSAATGIIPQTSSVIDGYNFSINPVGGDVTGTVTTNGYNITFNLQDVSYVVDVCSDSPSGTTAFSFEPTLSTDGFQKTYCLRISGTQLATDILNIIYNDTGLTNLFNLIVSNGAGNANLIVDGKCIFTTTSACDYTFDILNVPASGVYSTITSINGHSVSFAFNESNLPALEAYLNSLTYGTFVVTNPNSGEVLLTSTSNPNNLTSITYRFSGTNYIAAMTKDCTGYVPISANQAVQNIIDYLCGITDAQVETSQDYEICYVNPVTKTKQIVTISSGAAIADFLAELLARGCDTIDYIISINASTCGGIKNIFPQSLNVLQANDYLLGTKQGDCARILPIEFGTRLFQLGVFDNNFMNALCIAVALCAGGQMCAPFNYFYLDGNYGSPSDDTMDIIVYFNHSSAVSFTLRYARIDNTNNPTYITIPNVLPGDNPYTISGVADGQYIVGMKPIYADGRLCVESVQTTGACTGINSFSAIIGGSPSAFIISYNAAAALPKIRVNISYPNGGAWSQIYTNDGIDIDITPPPNVYGDFYITLTPVCNENTGFFGLPTAPVILTYSNPNAVVVPIVSITGTVDQTARGIIVNTSASISCSISLFIQGIYDNSGTPTNFGATVVLPAGSTHGSNLIAVPIGGVITCISSNYMDGISYYYSLICNGTQYDFLLAIDTPCP